MGKSTAGNLLLSQGFSLVDTDIVARQIVQPGQPALDEIKDVFGNDVISGAGELNREKLAKIVFADSSSRKRLETILHPRIRKTWQAEVQAWHSQGKTIGFVVIPLLFETGAAQYFDSVICVACSQATQMERLKSRGWTEGDVIRRISAQWPVEKKMGSSDYIVWTETNLETHAAQLQRIISIDH